MAKKILILVSLVILIVFAVFLINKKPQPGGNGTTPPSPEGNSTAFEFAWVTLTASPELNFVVEDSLGNKTGFNSETNTEYNEIPESTYGSNFPPGMDLQGGANPTIFEVKVTDDFDFTVTVFGPEGNDYFYDYSMESNIPEVFSDRKVEQAFVIGPDQKETLNFQFSFK